MFRVLNWIAFFFAAIGAMNWGFVAFFNFNLVSYLTNLVGNPSLNNFLYGIIAFAGLYTLLALFRGSV